MKKTRKLMYKATYKPGKGWIVLVNNIEPLYDRDGCLVAC